jgi:hypothetical protein
MSDRIKSYEELSQRLQHDEEFKQRFLSDPKSMLTEIGVKIPDSVRIIVHEDSLLVRNFVIPVMSQGNDLNVSDPLFKKVLQKAKDDENFKTQLLQHPKAVIEKFIGEDLPDSITICIHEDTPTLRNLVISTILSTEELTDQELEAVAGGVLENKILRKPTPGFVGPF